MAALGANDPAEILHVLAYRIEMKSAETACAVAKFRREANCAGDAF
jgi:hypothetical protein